MNITAIWKPEYSVGNQEIDNQHKYLFGLWFMLDSIKNQHENKLALKEALLGISDYVEIHFSYEEKLLKNHPGFAQHRKLHADFIARVNDFIKLFEEDDLDVHHVVDYLYNWLVKHIIEVDKKYFKEL